MTACVIPSPQEQSVWNLRVPFHVRYSKSNSQGFDISPTPTVSSSYLISVPSHQTMYDAAEAIIKEFRCAKCSDFPCLDLLIKTSNYVARIVSFNLTTQGNEIMVPVGLMQHSNIVQGSTFAIIWAGVLFVVWYQWYHDPPQNKRKQVWMCKHSHCNSPCFCFCFFFFTVSLRIGYDRWSQGLIVTDKCACRFFLMGQIFWHKVRDDNVAEWIEKNTKWKKKNVWINRWAGECQVSNHWCSVT